MIFQKAPDQYIPLLLQPPVSGEDAVGDSCGQDQTIILKQKVEKHAGDVLRLISAVCLCQCTRKVRRREKKYKFEAGRGPFSFNQMKALIAYVPERKK